jgi:anaerobic magnesium-protoporphyrin IX monomethyl ester cyclase
MNFNDSLESGSQEILDAMDKGITVEQIHQSTRLLRDAGIRVGFFLQFGYPGETQEEIEQTVEMVRSAMPDEIGVSVSYPLPGTKFYERVRAEMGSKQNWSESADLAMMFQGAYPTEFYRVLAKYIHKDHRLRQGMQALGSIVSNGRKPAQTSLRRIALAPWYLMSGGMHWLEMQRLRRPRAEGAGS